MSKPSQPFGLSAMLMLFRLGDGKRNQTENALGFLQPSILSGIIASFTCIAY